MTEPAATGVAAVDRALSILSAFLDNDKSLTLAELSRRTGLYKSTTLRLLASLERHHFVLRLPDGQYSLGIAVFRLGMLYERSWDLHSRVQPALEALVESTGESATFYVRERDQRLCLMRCDSRQSVRDHLPVGTLLPMDRGSGAHILRRYERGPGAYRGESLIVTSRGERDKEVGGVGAPVFGHGDRLIGALCISGTVTRIWAPDRMKLIKIALLAEAKRITATLGGDGRLFES